jgi:hypothetical protein
MFVLRLLCFVTASCPISAPQSLAEVPTHHPELIEGPWEIATVSGIDGISFETLTSFSGPAGHEQFRRQTVSIRAYHREGGKEVWGYFATQEKPSPQSYSLENDHSLTLFDGERLRIHFVDVTVLKSFDLDVTFSGTARAWTGTWSHSRQSSRVVLKRSQPNPGVTLSVFVGDWSGESSETSPDSGSLHIRQSTDGMLTAWCDRASSNFNLIEQSMDHERRNGEFLRVSSASASDLLLVRSESGGPGFSYQGTLSEDRQVLEGTWTRMGGGGLNAPTRFRKVPGSRENR